MLLKKDKNYKTKVYSIYSFNYYVVIYDKIISLKNTPSLNDNHKLITSMVTVPLQLLTPGQRCCWHYTNN